MPERDYRDATELFKASRYDDALAKLTPIVAADPAHWQAWQIIGNCRNAKGDRAGALEAYRRSLELHPGNQRLKAFVDKLGAP